jgi:nitrile hydratase accessory protein
MSATVDRALADTTGPAALPRRNGELVFAAPWQSRAFGLAVALHDAGAVDYEEFRARLIAEISAWEAERAAGDESESYYERWLDALERVVVERGLASVEELAVGRQVVAHRRAHDHEHQHEHEHEHEHGVGHEGAREGAQ